MGNGWANFWWCQAIPEVDGRNLITISPNGRPIAGTRKIIFQNDIRRALEFNFFTSEQYEELRGLLPNDRACKVNGCYNNHCRFGGDVQIDTKVENGICGYHRAEQEGRLGEYVPNENEENNNINLDDIGETISKACHTYENSNNLTEINQSISDLENIKVSNNEAFKNWGCEEVLNQLKSKKTALELNRENESSGTGSDNSESQETTSPPNNTTNSALQEAKNNAIREIIVALVGQEPKLTTIYDLSEHNRDWKQKINESNSEEEISNIKERVLNDIQAVRKEKQEVQKNKNIIEEGHRGDVRAKAEAIEKVEETEGENSYRESETELQKLKDELFRENPKKRCQSIVRTVEKKLTKNGLSEKDLSEKNQKALVRLKNDEINEIEKGLFQEIGEKGTQKRFKNLVKLVEKILQAGTPAQREELRTKLIEIINGKNKYEQIYKKEAQFLLNKLENYTKTSQNPVPWNYIIPFSLLGIIVIAGMVMVIRKRRKKNY